MSKAISRLRGQHNCGTDTADRGALAPLVGKFPGRMRGGSREDRVRDSEAEALRPTCATMDLWLPVQGRMPTSFTNSS